MTHYDVLVLAGGEGTRLAPRTNQRGKLAVGFVRAHASMANDLLRTKVLIERLEQLGRV